MLEPLLLGHAGFLDADCMVVLLPPRVQDFWCEGWCQSLCAAKSCGVRCRKELHASIHKNDCVRITRLGCAGLPTGWTVPRVGSVKREHFNALFPKMAKAEPFHFF